MEKETVKAGQTSGLSVSQASRQLVGLSKLDECISSINESLDDLRQGFFDIGSELSKVKEDNLFRFVGYESIYDFAEQTFGFKSTLTKNLINVYESFKDENGCMLDDFDDVPSSRLIELLPLKDDKDLCKDLKDLPVASIKSAKKVVTVAKAFDDGMQELVRKLTPVLIRCLDDSGLGSFELQPVEPDYGGDSCPDYVIKVANKDISGLEIDITQDGDASSLVLSKTCWHWYFPQRTFDLTDDLEKSVYEPMVKSLKEGIALNRKYLEEKKEEAAKSKAEKKAAKVPFKKPATHDEIKAYLADDNNWSQCGYIYNSEFSVYALSHCSHVFRFVFADDSDGKNQILYFDFLPSMIRLPSVGPFDINQLADIISPDDRWEK